MAMLKRDARAVAIGKESSHRPNPLGRCVAGPGCSGSTVGACTLPGFAFEGRVAFRPGGVLPGALSRMGGAIHRMVC